MMVSGYARSDEDQKVSRPRFDSGQVHMPFKDLNQKREYQKRWIAERRKEWFAEHSVCEHCGSTEELEVDHIDSSQKIDHKVWSWSRKRRDAELAKCQVLCRTCHLAKSREYGEQPQAVTHGVCRMYEKYGCRCAPCTKAHTDYQRSWRDSKKVNAR